MARYVAFLRGINLGSTNKVSMPRLRELAEGLGYTDVVTYINSGNLVLTATDPAATIEQRLTEAIADELGLKVDVAVRTPARLSHDRGREPLPGRRPELGHGGVPDQGGAGRRQAQVAEMATEHGAVRLLRPEVYVHYTKGQGAVEVGGEVLRSSGSARPCGTCAP